MFALNAAVLSVVLYNVYHLLNRPHFIDDLYEHTDKHPGTDPSDLMTHPSIAILITSLIGVNCPGIDLSRAINSLSMFTDSISDLVTVIHEGHQAMPAPPSHSSRAAGRSISSNPTNIDVHTFLDLPVPQIPRNPTSNLPPLHRFIVDFCSAGPPFEITEHDVLVVPVRGVAAVDSLVVSVWIAYLRKILFDLEASEAGFLTAKEMAGVSAVISRRYRDALDAQLLNLKPHIHDDESWKVYNDIQNAFNALHEPHAEEIDLMDQVRELKDLIIKVLELKATPQYPPRIHWTFENIFGVVAPLLLPPLFAFFRSCKSSVR